MKFSLRNVDFIHSGTCLYSAIPFGFKAKLTKGGRTAILVRLVLCFDPIGGWGKGTLEEGHSFKKPHLKHMATPQSTSVCPSFLWWNLGFTLPEVIIAKTKKDILNFGPIPQESNYNSLLLIWRRGLRSPLFRRLSAGWGMHRSAMSLDLLASLSRPNVIREDLPKHHLVIKKDPIQSKERVPERKMKLELSG